MDDAHNPDSVRAGRLAAEYEELGTEEKSIKRKLSAYDNQYDKLKAEAVKLAPLVHQGNERARRRLRELQSESDEIIVKAMALIERDHKIAKRGKLLEKVLTEQYGYIIK
jgi:hypothetical protein